MITPDIATHHFKAPDGVDLAWHELAPADASKGWPVLLIHGYFSNAATNWVRYGHARRLADAGFRVIMPDLRAHGQSGKPHDPAAYPPDILATDAVALVDHLGIGGGYNLGGYSLGARTALRMLATGARPRRVVLAGMGYDGTVNAQGRGGFFRNVLTRLGSFDRGSSEWMAEAFLKTTGGDPEALLPILDTFVDTPPEALARIDRPALVVCGREDDDNGSAERLARAIPGARYVEIPGNHMSAVTRPELGQAIVDFLTGDAAA